MRRTLLQVSTLVLGCLVRPTLVLSAPFPLADTASLHEQHYRPSRGRCLCNTTLGGRPRKKPLEGCRCPGDFPVSRILSLQEQPEKSSRGHCICFTTLGGRPRKKPIEGCRCPRNSKLLSDNNVHMPKIDKREMIGDVNSHAHGGSPNDPSKMDLQLHPGEVQGPQHSHRKNEDCKRVWIDGVETLLHCKRKLHRSHARHPQASELDMYGEPRSEKMSVDRTDWLFSRRRWINLRSPRYAKDKRPVIIKTRKVTSTITTTMSEPKEFKKPRKHRPYKRQKESEIILPPLPIPHFIQMPTPSPIQRTMMSAQWEAQLAAKIAASAESLYENYPVPGVYNSVVQAKHSAEKAQEMASLAKRMALRNGW